jgi:hypothetical protein
MCCGQKRSALRTAPFAGKTANRARLPIDLTPTRRPSTALPLRDNDSALEVLRRGAHALTLVPDPAPVSLRYVRTAPMRMVGEVSGRQYEFSGLRPTQAVDPRDLFQLLSMGYFSRA